MRPPWTATGAATATSFAERREHLKQAIRLSRVFMTLTNALQRRRAPRGSLREHLGMTGSVQSAKQPSAAAPAKSAKQPSAAAAVPAPTESARQPSGRVSAEVERACALASAKSAKQPSAGLPPAPASRLAHAAPGDVIKFAKQPWPTAPALDPVPLAITYRTPGASRALAAALMDGTSLRIGE